MLRDLLKLSGMLTFSRSAHRYMSFETAVGMNGRVWVKASTAYETILLANAIRSAELMTPKQVKRLVKDLVQSATRQ